MSDTPRTDAEANGGNSMGVLMGNGLRYALVQSEFARQLERELNAANERIKRLEEAGNDLAWWFCQKEESQLSSMQSAALKRWRDLRVGRNP